MNAIAIIETNAHRFCQQTLYEASKHTKNFCRLEFDDITQPHDDYVIPSIEHIQNAIDFLEAREIKDTRSLVVACAAGISRSSALAYIIQSWFAGKADTSIIDPTRHIPNKLMVKLGEQVTGLQLLKPLNEFYNITQPEYNFFADGKFPIDFYKNDNGTGSY